MPYKKYLQSISKMNTYTEKRGKEDEIKRYAESDIYWTENKEKIFREEKFKKGEVCQFEFGKNFIPEMSYEHRGLIIGSSKKLLYVLPIYSKNSDNSEHRKAYHPTDNPVQNDLYLLKASEYGFLTHDSVLKLNELKTISIKRKKYRQGRIDVVSNTYIEIERMAFARCFPTYSFKYDNILKENQELQEEIERLKLEIAHITSVYDTVAATKE